VSDWLQYKKEAVKKKYKKIIKKEKEEAARDCDHWCFDCKITWKVPALPARAPPPANHGPRLLRATRRAPGGCLRVATHAAFESKTLKPVSHCIDSRVKPGAFKL
jgi:hypothetical protein